MTIKEEALWKEDLKVSSSKEKKHVLWWQKSFCEYTTTTTTKRKTGFSFLVEIIVFPFGGCKWGKPRFGSF